MAMQAVWDENFVQKKHGQKTMLRSDEETHPLSLIEKIAVFLSVVRILLRDLSQLYRGLNPADLAFGQCPFCRLGVDGFFEQAVTFE